MLCSYTRITVLFLISTAAVGAAAQQTPTYHTDTSDGFIRDWLLIGPFPLTEVDKDYPKDAHAPGFETDFLAAHSGEATPSPADGTTVTVGDYTRTWFRHRSETDHLDLDAAISTNPASVAYAYCEIQSDSEKAAILSLGSNDGMRAWLNSEEVYDRPDVGAMRQDGVLLPVLLKRGRNTLCLKIEERAGSWQFAGRILPLDHEVVSNRRDLFFQVQSGDNTAPKIATTLTRENFQALVKNVDYQVRAQHTPDETLLTGSGGKKSSIPLKVDTRHFGEYVLDLDAQFAGGASYRTTIPFTAGERVAHALFENGQSAYRIVLGPNASESEQWAAQELQHWLREIGGATLPIKTGGKVDGPAIYLGYNKTTRRLLGRSTPRPAAEDQSFTYRNAGPDIVIYGGRNVGTQYGVMSFLEREFGCRWYTPSVSVAPKRDRRTFTLLHHTESPDIRVRNVFYYEAFDPIWAARNRSNGLLTFNTIREQPGGVESYWSVHTFNRLVPPDEFFDESPEYFSLIDGKRTAHEAQLCLTNDDVWEIVTERTLQVMRENPGHLIYSVSQNDGYGPCQCDPCQAIVKEEGTEQGPILRLVNHVAEAAEKEFPDKFIGTLAYVYSQKPPKNLRPRDNVVIRLCSFDCSWVQPYATHPLNKAFVDDIERWSEIAPKLYIWDYVVEFGHYLMPYPNMHALQGNIQFFRDHNAIGVMPQAAYQSRGGEFAELRAYVLSKLLWDPECDVDAVIDDFIYGYYGRSGQYIRTYLDGLQALITPETWIRKPLPDGPTFTEAFIAEADSLFDQAETVAENETMRRRVEMARLSILYLKCIRTPKEAKEDGTYARFREIAEREGITHYSEKGKPYVEEFHAKMDAL